MFGSSNGRYLCGGVATTTPVAQISYLSTITLLGISIWKGGTSYFLSNQSKQSVRPNSPSWLLETDGLSNLLRTDGRGLGSPSSPSGLFRRTIPTYVCNRRKRLSTDSPSQGIRVAWSRVQENIPNINQRAVERFVSACKIFEREVQTLCSFSELCQFLPNELASTNDLGH